MNRRFFAATVIALLLAPSAPSRAHDLHGALVTLPEFQLTEEIVSAQSDVQVSLASADPGESDYDLHTNAVISNALLWSPHALSICFNGGTSAVRRMIAGAMTSAWPLGSLTHDRLTYGPTFTTPASCASSYPSAADIKVSFLSDSEHSGLWSYVGTDSLLFNPSMNLQDFNVTLPADWKSIVAHEMGHALGLQHEHQSPLAPICQWDLAPNGYIATHYIWRNREQMLAQFNKLDNYLLSNGAWALTTTQYDRQSIMHYYFEAGAFLDGASDSCHIDKQADAPDHLDRLLIAATYGPNPQTRQQQLTTLQATLDSPFVQGRPELKRLLKAKLILMEKAASAP